MLRRLIGLVDRSGSHVGRGFDPTTTFAPPQGPRSSWVHYGVMVPGLPEPHRTFGVMAIVGTPGVSIFANDHAITTTPADTAYLVSATAAMRSDTFHAYSVAGDCAFAPDGSSIRFGDDLTIEGSYPRFELHRRHPDGDVRMSIEATDKVTEFVDLRGGLYTHWSLLCRYEGTFGGVTASGLCTLEHARGIGRHSLPLPGPRNVPTRSFTYHVLNVDDSTQLLFGQVRGPGGLGLLRSTYVRGLTDPGARYDDTRFVVEEREAAPLVTPDGREMRMPTRFTLRARGRGRTVIDIEGRPHGDWAYGLGAGFVGSYAYTGTYEDRPIEGTAYMEYVDLA